MQFRQISWRHLHTTPATQNSSISGLKRSYIIWKHTKDAARRLIEFHVEYFTRWMAKDKSLPEWKIWSQQCVKGEYNLFISSVPCASFQMEFIMWVVYGFCIHLNFNDLFYQDWRNFISTLRFCVRISRDGAEFNRFECVYRRKPGRIFVMKMKFSCSMLWRLMIGNLNSCGHGAINWLFTLPYGCISCFAVGNSANHRSRPTCHWKLFFFELALTFLLAKAISAPRSSDGKELNDIWRVNRQNIQLSFIFDWNFIFCFSARPSGKGSGNMKIEKATK